jgi:predicted transcriptional regulator
MDMAYAKIQRVVKDDEKAFKEIKKHLFEHYGALKDIFLYELGHS